MKHILPFFFLLLTGCAWLDSDRGFPEADPVPTPPTDTFVEGSTDVVYYLPDIEGYDEWSPECQTDEVESVWGPFDVKEEAVKFVYDTVDFTRTVPLDMPEIEEADYIHVKSAVIEVVSGDDLDFLSWIKINIGGHEVAWGGPRRDNLRSLDLHVDGSIELKQFWVDKEVKATGQVRGKSPGQKTEIQSTMTFVRFFNCN